MFTLSKENKVQIDARMLWVPEFKKIWSSDQTKTKRKANLQFAYIYFMADYKSEYNIYGLEKRAAVARDIMGNENYEAPEIVLDAIEKYEKLQTTYSMKYLKSVRATIDSLMKFYEDLRYVSNQQQNVKDYDPTLVTKGMKDVEDVLQKLEKWEKKVASEEDNMQIRGGGELSMFEDKENATWLNQKTS